jgi:LacI family transcriptional regulator
MLRPERTGTQPSVSIDQRFGGQTAAQHLLDLGHRHLLFVGADDIFSRLRLEGARQAVVGVGARLECCPVRQAVQVEASYEGLQARLQRGLDFTAVLCADDLLAVGACKALLEADIAIPQQMSVVGYDDLRWAKLLTPPLTTVHQPQVSQGEIAMEMLIEMMKEKEVESKVLQPRLIVRGSSGPAPLTETASTLARAVSQA